MLSQELAHLFVNKFLSFRCFSIVSMKSFWNRIIKISEIFCLIFDVHNIRHKPCFFHFLKALGFFDFTIKINLSLFFLTHYFKPRFYSFLPRLYLLKQAFCNLNWLRRSCKTTFFFSRNSLLFTKLKKMVSEQRYSRFITI